MTDENPTFLETLSEDHRGNPALADFTDVDGLAKSFIDTQAMVGNSIQIPGEKGTPEEWGKIWNQMGRPEEAGGYQLTDWKQPEGFVADADMKKDFSSLSHDIGLSQTQSEKLNVWYGERIGKLGASMSEQGAKSREDGMAAIRSEFGQVAEERIDAASKALNHFADEATIEYLDKSGIGNNPQLIRVWIKVAEAMSEHGILGVGGNEGGMSLSPEQARNEIASNQKDGEFMLAYQTATHTDHEKNKDIMNNLFKVAYP